MVEMHGGTVRAESLGEGQGSTFTVRLPMSDRLPVTATPGLPPNGSPGSRRRVLVVDDNRDCAASMAMMLRLLGDEVHIAHDGSEAVEMAETYRPDAILMDVGMPR